jgi:hypothetical protein
MSRPSKVKRLPPEIREEIDKLLERSVPLDEILAKLRELGVGDVSRSGLGRYKQEIDAVGERIRRSREIADALVRRLGDAPESRQARLNIELMHSVILDLVMNAQDGEGVTLDPEQAMFLGRAMKDLASAQKSDAEFEVKIRRQVAAEAEKKLKSMEAEAARPGAAQRGFDPATLRRVREEIYGISS